MAEPPDSRMSDYVRQKNSQHQNSTRGGRSSGLHDDLKVFPQPPDGSFQQRSKKGKQNQVRQLPLSTAGKSLPFYNGDTPSLSDTSTSGSVLGHEVAGQDTRITQQQLGTSRQYGMSHHLGQQGGEPEHVQRPDAIHHEIEPRRLDHPQRTPITSHKTGTLNALDEDDSYPPTTSGGRSQPTSPTNGISPDRDMRYANEPFRVTQRSKSLHVGGNRRSDPKYASNIEDTGEALPPSLSFHALGQMRPQNVIEDINGEFTFAKPRATIDNSARAVYPQPELQPPPHIQVPPQPPPTTQQIRYRERPPRQHIEEPAQPQPQPLTDVGPGSHIPHMPGSRDHQSSAEAYSPGELDYDPAQLRAIPFTTLQEQPFDVDPRSGLGVDDFTLGSGADTLPQKLGIVAGRSVNEQSRFFASLALDEWEQAGDWFLDRFQNILQKLQEARRSKRDFARRFETEIHVRHEEVTKKRKLADGAFSSMRETGGKILQATPKKAKSLHE